MEVDEATLAPGGGRPRRWSGTDRRIPGGPGGELARASGDEDGSSVDPRRPAVGTANLARTTDDLRRHARDDRMTASAQLRPLGSVPIEPCRTIWRIRRGQRPVTFRKKDETIGGAPSSRESAGDGHQRTRFGAVSDSGSGLGVAIGRQLRSDAVKRCDRGCSECLWVLERHQAAALVVCGLSSGRRGRRFKSGHPDQLSLVSSLSRDHAG